MLDIAFQKKDIETCIRVINYMDKVDHLVEAPLLERIRVILLTNGKSDAYKKYLLGLVNKKRRGNSEDGSILSTSIFNTYFHLFSKEEKGSDLALLVEQIVNICPFSFKTVEPLLEALIERGDLSSVLRIYLIFMENVEKSLNKTELIDLAKANYGSVHNFVVEMKMEFTLRLVDLMIQKEVDPFGEDIKTILAGCESLNLKLEDRSDYQARLVKYHLYACQLSEAGSVLMKNLENSSIGKRLIFEHSLMQIHSKSEYVDELIFTNLVKIMFNYYKIIVEEEIKFEKDLVLFSKSNISFLTLYSQCFNGNSLYKFLFDELKLNEAATLTPLMKKRLSTDLENFFPEMRGRLRKDMHLNTI